MKYTNSTSDSEIDLTLTKQSGEIDDINDVNSSSKSIMEPDISFIGNCLLFETEGWFFL